MRSRQATYLVLLALALAWASVMFTFGADTWSCTITVLRHIIS